MRSLIIALFLTVSSIAFAGVDFIEMNAKYISKKGKDAVVEYKNKRYNIKLDQIIGAEKAVTGSMVKVRFSPADLNIKM